MRVILSTSALGSGTFSETSVDTTNANVTTIATIAVPTGKAILLNARVISRKDDFAQKGGFDVEATYCNNAGTVTLQGATPTNLYKQAQAGWEVTFVISTTNVLIRVKGAAATNVSWKCQATTIPV